MKKLTYNIETRRKQKSSLTDNIARLRTTDFLTSAELLGQGTIALSISGSKGRIPI